MTKTEKKIITTTVKKKKIITTTVNFLFMGTLYSNIVQFV